METPSRKELMMEFLLELLRDEREKRQAAERELETLRMILQPLQQREMDRIQHNRSSSVDDNRKTRQRALFFARETRRVEKESTFDINFQEKEEGLYAIVMNLMILAMMKLIRMESLL